MTIKLIRQRRYSFYFRAFSIFLALSLLNCFIAPLPQIFAQSVLFAPGAQSMNLPAPGMMVPLSSDFRPPIMKGIRIFPDNPLRFDFVIDSGDSKTQGDQFKEESTKLIKYFLAALTVPAKDIWVNLSPYEKDRIVPLEFGTTQMGRDMLAQDYLLKQITASLMYPEDGLGKSFWDKVYKKAELLYGTTNIPVNTFNKVWIVPEKAVVYKSKNMAFVMQSRLKVMLEADYLALKKNLDNQDLGTDQVAENDAQNLNDVSSDIVREVIIPELEKEVNEGENFAMLRQIYNSMILATWFKRNLKQSLLGKVYVGQNKVEGVDIEDKTAREKIYAQYLEAFQKGVYNYIKEEFDPGTQQTIPRKYFSGGVEIGEKLDKTYADVEFPKDNDLLVRVGAESPSDHDNLVSAYLQAENPLANLEENNASDKAMLSSVPEQFSLSKDYALGEKVTITQGYFSVGVDTKTGREKKELIVFMDADIVERFRDTLLSENITRDSVSAFVALRPVVEALSGLWAYRIDNRADRETFEEMKPDLDAMNERIKSGPIPRYQRELIIQQITDLIAALPVSVLQRVLEDSLKYVNSELSYWFRIQDWDNVTVRLIANTDRIGRLVRVDARQAVLEIDLFNFLKEYGGRAEYHGKEISRDTSTLNFLLKDFLDRNQTEGNLTGFIENNIDVVREVLNILFYMESELDAYYAIGSEDYGRNYSSKEQKKSYKQNLTERYRDFQSYENYEPYVRLFRRLAKITNVDTKDGTVLSQRSNLPGRIQAVFDFIAQNNALAQRADLRGRLTQEDIDKMVEIYRAFKKIDRYKIFVDATLAEKEEAKTTTETGVARPTTVAWPTALEGSVEEVTRDVYEERLLRERERTGPITYSSEGVMVYTPSGPERKTTTAPASHPRLSPDGSSPVQKTKNVRWVPLHRDEAQYLNIINPALEEMRTAPERQKARIFLDRIFPQFLIARADEAVTENIQSKIIEAAGLLDSPVRRLIEELIRLSADVFRNSFAIKSLAKELRNNPYLRAQGVYVYVEILTRSKRTLLGSRKIYLVSAISHEIDDVETRFVTVEGRAEPVPTTISYLGNRIDRIDEDVSALGFTYMGDTDGVVLKEMIKAATYYSVLRHLNNEPFVVPEGRTVPAVYYKMRQAIQRDYPVYPDANQVNEILESRYRSTADHEQQHTEDELQGIQARLTGRNLRVAQETVAYIQSIAAEDSTGKYNAPFTDLVKIMQLYLAYHFDLFQWWADPSGIYKEATENALLLFADRLGLDISRRDLNRDPLGTTDLILGRALETDHTRLKDIAKEIVKDIREDQKNGRPYVYSKRRVAEASAASTTTAASDRRSPAPAMSSAGDLEGEDDSADSSGLRRKFPKILIYVAAAAIAIFGTLHREEEKSVPDQINVPGQVTDRGPTSTPDLTEEINKIPKLKLGPDEGFLKLPSDILGDDFKRYLDEGIFQANHHVRHGENLSELSFRYYGSIRGVVRIYDANSNVLTRGYDFVPEGVFLNIPGAVDEFYRIQPGDTVGALVQRFYGANTAKNRRRIMNHNDIKNSFRLPVGKEIRIPMSDQEKIRYDVRKAQKGSALDSGNIADRAMLRQEEQNIIPQERRTVFTNPIEFKSRTSKMNIVFPPEISNELVDMTVLARKHNVELEAIVFLKEGKAVGVRYPKDDQKFAVVHSKSKIEREVTDTTNYFEDATTHIYRIQLYSKQIAEARARQDLTEVQSLENKIKNSLHELGEGLAQLNYDLKLFSVARSEWYHLDSAELLKIEDLAGVPELLTDLNNVQTAVSRWFGSHTFFAAEEVIPDHDDYMTIHSHPNEVPAPPSAILRADGSRIGDITTPGFFTGQVMGIIMDTPEGDHLFLFHEPDDTREEKYIEAYNWFWYAQGHPESGDGAKWSAEERTFGPSPNWKRVEAMLQNDLAMETPQPLLLTSKETTRDKAMLTQINEGDHVLEVIKASTSEEIQELRLKKSRLDQEFRDSFGLSWHEIEYQISSEFEDALVDHDVLIPENSAVAHLIRYPTTSKAFIKMLEAIDHNPQEAPQILHAIQTAGEVLQIGLQNPNYYNISAFWDQNNGLSLNDRIIYTLRAMLSEQSEYVVADIKEPLIDLFLDYAHKEHDQRQEIIEMVKDYQRKSHRAVTWWMMRQYRDVTAFKVYRGTPAPLYQEGRDLMLQDPTYFTFSEDYARETYYKPAQGGQLISMTVSIEAIEWFNWLMLNSTEVVVGEGNYGPPDFALLQKQESKPNAAKTTDKFGGIELNTDTLNLEEVSGENADLQTPYGPNQEINFPVNGYSPVIFRIIPATNLPLILGNSSPENVPNLSYNY